MPTRPRAARWAGAAAVSAAALVLTGCAAASAGGAPGSEGPPCPVAAVDVVASIEQWGDVAAALGGACAQVTTIVTGSVGDPHDYEPTPGDAAAFSRAQLLVLNGLHYDDWAEKVVETLDAMPAEVVGGAVVGLEPAAGSDAAPAGTNPHLWYSPSYVRQVAAAITAALTAQAPDAATYFQARAAQWQAAMKPYDDLVARIRAGATGKTYGATEGVADYLMQAVGLTDVTPEGWRTSTANDSDPSPGDLHAFDAALAARTMSVLVYNVQTEGAIPEQVGASAQAAGVPVVDVTESMPEGAISFVSWQTAQLEALAAALGIGAS